MKINGKVEDVIMKIQRIKKGTPDERDKEKFYVVLEGVKEWHGSWTKPEWKKGDQIEFEYRINKVGDREFREIDWPKRFNQSIDLAPVLIKLEEALAKLDKIEGMLGQLMPMPKITAWKI